MKLKTYLSWHMYMELKRVRNIYTKVSNWYMLKRFAIFSYFSSAEQKEAKQSKGNDEIILLSVMFTLFKVR